MEDNETLFDSLKMGFGGKFWPQKREKKNSTEKCPETQKSLSKQLKIDGAGGGQTKMTCVTGFFNLSPIVVLV